MSFTSKAERLGGYLSDPPWCQELKEALDEWLDVDDDDELGPDDVKAEMRELRKGIDAYSRRLQKLVRLWAEEQKHFEECLNDAVDLLESR